jgi:hypothetical protein
MNAKAYLRALLALAIMIVAAIYQRITGPTYPLNIDLLWNKIHIAGELPRSHAQESDLPVEITVPDTSVRAVLIYRRFKTDDEWTGMKMERNGEKLSAALPQQPPAGKLEYFIQLQKNTDTFVIPLQRMIVARFTGVVPGVLLLPHIILMFFAMLLSTWAGLEAAFRGEKMYILTYLTTILLFAGGIILGPLVQKYAFGEFWTGVPFGFDLTDNKTLLAMIAWVFASLAAYRKKSARIWIIAAAVILMIVYSIPHSVMGSELNYQTMQVDSGN